MKIDRTFWTYSTVWITSVLLYSRDRPSEYSRVVLCCVGSYHRFQTRVFWSMIMIKLINEKWKFKIHYVKFDRLYTDKIFDKFRLAVLSLSWFKKSLVWTCGMIPHNTCCSAFSSDLLSIYMMICFMNQIIIDIFLL